MTSYDNKAVIARHAKIISSIEMKESRENSNKTARSAGSVISQKSIKVQESVTTITTTTTTKVNVYLFYSLRRRSSLFFVGHFGFGADHSRCVYITKQTASSLHSYKTKSQINADTNKAVVHQ